MEIVWDEPAELGEGALWDIGSKAFYWVDIPGKKAMCYDPVTKTNKEWSTPTDCGTVVVCEDGHLAVSQQDGFYKINTDTGYCFVLNKCNNNPEVRFNDGKCDPAGRFWSGTMSYDDGRYISGLYSLDFDNKVVQYLDKIGVSNGLVWNSKGDKFYYIDTPTKRVDCFDYNMDTGEIKNRKVVIDLRDCLGYPDGCCIDAEGMLWIAFWGGSRIGRYNPRTGKLLEDIVLENVELVTACAFGGKNLDELYITTARAILNEEQRRNQVHAGKLFRTKVANTQGVPSYRFKSPV